MLLMDRLRLQRIATVLERCVRSFFLRAGSKAREGFVLMAKRHDLPRVILQQRADTPQMLALLPLVYRHDHSVKRYAYWASLELGVQLVCRALQGPAEAAVNAEGGGDASAELQRETACDALVGMCEWSAGGGRSQNGPQSVSMDGKQWGLSVLAELSESCSSDGTLAHALVASAVAECSDAGSVQLGVRALTAVLGLSAALKQPTSSKSLAAINLANAVAEAVAQLSNALPKWFAADVPATREGHQTREARGTALVGVVRCLGAACEFVGSAGSEQAVAALRYALVAVRVGSRLILLLLSGAGGTLAAPSIMAAITAAWTVVGLRDEILLDGFWVRWGKQVLERAQLYASGVEVVDELPTLGHITSLSYLVDTEVVRRIIDRNHVWTGEFEGSVDRSEWAKLWKDHMGGAVLEARQDEKAGAKQLAALQELKAAVKMKRGGGGPCDGSCVGKCRCGERKAPAAAGRKKRAGGAAGGAPSDSLFSDSAGAAVEGLPSAD